MNVGRIFLQGAIVIAGTVLSVLQGVSSEGLVFKYGNFVTPGMYIEHWLFPPPSGGGLNLGAGGLLSSLVLTRCSGSCLFMRRAQLSLGFGDERANRNEALTNCGQRHWFCGICDSHPDNHPIVESSCVPCELRSVASAGGRGV
jgi:hypothetical protein